ncbi:MAG: 2,3-diphosphoglycerate-dependent phosphoglycerate mutase [Alphaproteobacteria bacterium]|nr:2,3-diphosphoglycerate-dependent phosphoglycerate mutase [Alphaproteobacteria bacterium]
MSNFLVLLRHGQSQWNLENRFTGFYDVDLTPKGESEAVAAGEMIAKAGFEFDKVFSSTQIRANRTAQIALEAAGQGELFEGITRHEHLRERDYGDLTGLDKDETRTKYGEDQVHLWRRSYDIAPPGGECLGDVVENRVRPYFNEHIKPLLDSGKNVLVVAHGNSLRAILITLGVETPATINDAEFPTGVPLAFELDGGKIVRRYFLEDK